MTDSGPWRDYARSRAVLIGAWDYTHLPPISPARNSLARMARLLTGPLCGWPVGRVEVLHNVRRRDRLPDRLMQLYDGVTGIALFYFVGHGQLHGDELCLALRESPSEGPRRLTTGLPFTDVRAALRECDAQTKIVILDCCFSGQAALPRYGLAAPSTDIVELTLGTGAFTMAASGAYRTAWFETDPSSDGPQTYFTKYLIDVIDRGMPGHPDGLPLGAIFAQTSDALARDQRPAPTRSVRHDADRFILARNAAPPTESPPPTASTPATGSVATDARRPRRRTLLLAGLGAVTAVAVPGGWELVQKLRRPGVQNTATLTYTSMVLSVAFGPDSKVLASIGADNTVDLWNTETRVITAVLNAISADHLRGVTSVALHPNGRTLAVSCDDRTVKLWDIATRSASATYTNPNPPSYLPGVVSFLAISPDGRTLACGSYDTTIKLLDGSTAARTATLAGHTSAVLSVAFSPDGKTLASASIDHTVKLWDVAGGTDTATLTGHTGMVSSVAFSPDGKTLASGSEDKTIKLWDGSSGTNLATLTGHNIEVTSVAFSPDSRTLASGSYDKTVKLWDVASRANTATLTGHTNVVSSVAFSPDGTLASCGDNTIKLWKIS